MTARETDAGPDPHSVRGGVEVGRVPRRVAQRQIVERGKPGHWWVLSRGVRQPPCGRHAGVEAGGMLLWHLSWCETGGWDSGSRRPSQVGRMSGPLSAVALTGRLLRL